MTVLSFIETILNFIFPSHAKCLLCGSALGGNDRICSSCQTQITGYGNPFCSICGRYWSLEAGAKTAICQECSDRCPPFTAARSVGVYGEVLRNAIYMFKYQGYRSLGEDFGVMMADLFMREPILQLATALVPVPLSREKLKLRGFNQSELLALKMSSVLGIPVRNYLVKGTNTPSQSKLNREARIASVQGVFQLNNSPHGERILLIDDIFTTGATSGECSRVLLQGGAHEVAVLTLASGILEKRFRGSLTREEKVGTCRNLV